MDPKYVLSAILSPLNSKFVLTNLKHLRTLKILSGAGIHPWVYLKNLKDWKKLDTHKRAKDGGQGRMYVFRK